MHPIFALEPGDRLELHGVHSVLTTYLRPARPLALPVRLSWPVGEIDGVSLRLDEAAPADERSAAKHFAGPRSPATACIRGSRCALTLRADVPYFGVYLNRGGWPTAGSGLHQLGLEPTTSPADHLGSAIEGATHQTLAPAAAAEWNVRLTLDETD